MPITTKSKSRNRDFQELLEELKTQGWTVETTARGHMQLKAPDGKGLVTAGGNYGDFRAIRNLIAQLRRNGFQVPAKFR